MSLEKVFFGFFVLMAATLNFGFFLGDMTSTAHHSSAELYAAIVVGLVATVLKLGDRTQIGAIHLSTSLVADLQLITAAVLYTIWLANLNPVPPSNVALVVSLSGGALLANLVSVVLLVVETASFHRR